MRYVVTLDGRPRRVEVGGHDGRYRVTLDGEPWEVDLRPAGPGSYSLLVGGVSHLVTVTAVDGQATVAGGGAIYALEVEEETRHLLRTRGGAAGGAGRRTLLAPLPGRVTLIRVTAGDPVAAGDTLVVIEAMKMENELTATGPGRVSEVRVQPGQSVNAGDVLVVLE